MKKIVLFFPLLIVLSSCKKDNAPTVLSGSWVFRSQFSGTYLKPQKISNVLYTNSFQYFNFVGNPVSYDAVQISFQNNGAFTSNYVYGNTFVTQGSNYSLPKPYNGTYIIVNDSVASIQPGNSPVLVGSYTYLNTLTLPNGNNIRYKLINGDSLVLYQMWNYKETNPVNVNYDSTYYFVSAITWKKN